MNNLYTPIDIIERCAREYSIPFSIENNLIKLGSHSWIVSHTSMQDGALDFISSLIANTIKKEIKNEA